MGRNRKLQEEYGTNSPTELAARLGVSRQRADQLLNRQKHRCRSLLNYAVRTGKVKVPTSCQRCEQSDSRLEAHHDDYERPLDVMWVCPPCHAIVHPHHPYATYPALSESLKAETARRKATEYKQRVRDKDVMAALRKKCESQGMSFSEINPMRAIINRVPCEVGKLSVRPSTGVAAIQPRRGRVYDDEFDFSIRYNVRHDIWMIIPANKYPSNGTSFVLAEPKTNRRGAYTDSHEYRTYIEAWHFLAVRAEEQAA